MALTKTVTMQNTDGETYSTIEVVACLPIPPPRTVRRKSPNGITRAHALNGDGSVTCTLTFPYEATFDNGMVQHDPTWKAANPDITLDCIMKIPDITNEGVGRIVQGINTHMM